MSFRIDCPCGLGHEVTAAQAGAELGCRCGRTLCVPSLSQLNRGATAPASIRGGGSGGDPSGAAATTMTTTTATATDNPYERSEAISHAPVGQVKGSAIVGRDMSALRLTMFAVFLPILILLVSSVWLLPGNNPADAPYAIALSAVALVAAPCALGYLAARRVGFMRRILNAGPRVDGEITHVWYSLPWPLSKTPKGYLEYRFDYHGETHDCSTTVFKSAATSGFLIGDQVTIAVNPDAPQQAFIVEMYL